MIQLGINKDARHARMCKLVMAERQRRLELGFTFGGNVFDFDTEAITNINGAGSSAGIAVALGSSVNDYRWANAAVDFKWLAKNNLSVLMDAHDCFAFSQAAMAHKSAHVFAARTLKDMTIIPADFIDDKYWP